MLLTGIMKEISDELIKLNIHIRALQQTRQNGNGWIDKKEYSLLHSGQKRKVRKN
jgi:hypothetical protein